MPYQDYLIIVWKRRKFGMQRRMLHTLFLTMQTQLPFLHQRPIMWAVVAALVDAAPSSCFKVSIDKELLNHIKLSYKNNPWCEKLVSASKGLPNVQNRNGLWYIGDRLVVPRESGLREIIYRIAHDNLWHFSFYKCYDNMQDSYFWPNMCKDLEEKYILGCPDCQRNKSSTIKQVGPLHRSDCILTITDRLSSDIQIIATRMDIMAEELAIVFIDNWYCENRLPLEIVSDRDKLFVAKFWKVLHKLTGVKSKLSTMNHPETDGSSEHTNKTVNQCLCFHVEQNQKGWKKALPHIQFFLMNTVNKSTGYSPFQLKYGCSPRVLPYFKENDTTDKESLEAQEIVEMIQKNVSDAKGNLLLAKILQAYFTTKKGSPKIEYKIGDKVMLSTKNRHQEFKEKPGDGRVTKFMPRYDGPWEVIEAWPETSSYAVPFVQVLFSMQIFISVDAYLFLALHFFSGDMYFSINGLDPALGFLEVWSTLDTEPWEPCTSLKSMTRPSPWLWAVMARWISMLFSSA